MDGAWCDCFFFFFYYFALSRSGLFLSCCLSSLLSFLYSAILLTITLRSPLSLLSRRICSPRPVVFLLSFPSYPLSPPIFSLSLTLSDESARLAQEELLSGIPRQHQVQLTAGFILPSSQPQKVVAKPHNVSVINQRPGRGEGWKVVFCLFSVLFERKRKG